MNTWVGRLGLRFFFSAVVAFAGLGILAPCKAVASAIPSISTEPQSQSVLVGSNAVFTVEASGQGTLGYQWSLNGTNLTDSAHISGSTSTNLTISGVVAGDGGNYQVVVSNSHGSVPSSNATLTVLIPAAITSQPTNTVAFIGGSAVFSVTDIGTAPRFEQWQKDGTNLINDGRVNGASSPVLSISNIQMSDVGSYQFVVTNAYGGVASKAASLLVVPVVAWGGIAYGPPSLTNTVAIASGLNYNLALGTDGKVTEWGSGVVTAGLSNVVAIAAGDGAPSLALKRDGTVVAWDDNGQVETNVPAGLSNVVAIASGGACLALRSDGTVVAWGSDAFGQTNVPVGLSNVVAIAAGYSYNLALLNDDRVVGWGYNGYGEASLPTGVSNVVAIAAASLDSLVLRNDGSIVAWGGDFYGQTNVPVGLSNVVAIASTASHDLALKNDGTVAAWGDNAIGETNVPTYLKNVVAIAAGNGVSVALEQNPIAPMPPAIWWQPAGRTYAPGQSVLLLPYVIGSLPMRFQWLLNGAPLAGETNKWLLLSSLQPAEVGGYQFVVANNYGAVTSQVATVTESPGITGQPASQAVVQSSNAVFTAAAIGSPPLSYQWYFNGAPLADGGEISGSTTTNLNIANVQTNDAGSYQLVVTNNYGATTSAVATLSLLFPPTIATSPTQLWVAVGNTAYFPVTASGTSPFHFQWQRNGTNIADGGRYAGADVTVWTGETFTIANVDTSDSDVYQVVVSNAYGQITSPVATLSVGYPPYGNIDPLSQSVPLNGTATFYALVVGGGPFTCQWQKNGINITNDNRVSSTNDPLVISPVVAGDAGSYSVIVSNAYGTLDLGLNYNAPGVLTVLLPPSITTQPQSQSAPAGTNVTFSVFATSPNGSLSYQWRFDGTNISGATAASITLTNVQLSNAGSYDALVSNSGGSVTSSVAQLTVTPSAPWFITPLQSQGVSIGQTVVFDPTARGSEPLSFRWEFNGTNLPGATSATLDIPNAQTNNSGPYLVVVTNSYGSITSAVAVLTVENPVQIVGQPASQAVLLGSNASFTVTATGTALDYQWYFNGTALADGSRISGSGTPTLSISDVQSGDAGGYVAVVSNLLSSAMSLTASLTPQATLSPSVRYVALTSTNPTPPYLNWSTAATNIQDAIDAAVAGDLVLVSNGVYQTGGRAVYGTATNRVVIDKAITVQSVNGPFSTIIKGGGFGIQDMPNIRCAYLTNGATLTGFTLTNGGTTYRYGNVLHVLREESGGGVWCESSDAIVSNCILTGNNAYQYGGGAFSGTFDDCIVTNNHANYGGGAASNVFNNCILQNNFAGAGGGAYGSTVVNCTIVNNFASAAGPEDGGGLYGGSASNSIIYYNFGTQVYGSIPMYYCCTTLLPTNGVGNITNEPAFASLTDGDFHLQFNSPCINSGNNAYVSSPTDLDGNPRIVGGTVDIGAYEYQTPVSKISYAWLQQYGLPITTNIDSADLDGTAFNVYQDWIAGLNPTNASSVLAMLPPVPTNSPTGLLVSWDSVGNRTYFLQSSTNLAAHPAFSTIQSNIVGQPDMTSFMDTNAIGNGPFFYRVGVQ